MALPWRPIDEVPEGLERALLYGTHSVDIYKPGDPSFLELGPADKIQVGSRDAQEHGRHPGIWSIEDTQGGWHMRPTHFAVLHEIAPSTSI